MRHCEKHVSIKNLLSDERVCGRPAVARVYPAMSDGFWFACARHAKPLDHLQGPNGMVTRVEYFDEDGSTMSAEELLDEIWDGFQKQAKEGK